ncbi:MAG: SDR family oxidoreductase [Sphingobacteriales bacterium]|jgi:short-subunit dehydrogenase|nr:SDR family oxidoreductase [Sphingobacteriales bacterium]
MEKLKGKRVLIAGASGDIGSATARQLAQSGAQVFVTGRDQTVLDHLAHELALPAEQVFVADLSVESQVNALATAFSATTVPFDILIQASGVGIIKPFEQLVSEDLHTSMAVNFYSTFYLLKACLPAMKAQGKGLIIHLPGVLGKTPMAGASVYAASKYALNGFMKSLREELKRTEIRITQVFLGGVDSGFWDNIDLRVQRDKMIRPDEVAKAIWFLCQQPESGVVSELVLQPFNHQAI